MSATSKKLLATIEFCETNFISEYSIDKLLQGWSIKNNPKCSAPSFLNELIAFLKSLPLVYFNNSGAQVGKIVEQVRKIMLAKTTGNETPQAMDKGLNILRAKKMVISYI